MQSDVLTWHYSDLSMADSSLTTPLATQISISTGE